MKWHVFKHQHYFYMTRIFLKKIFFQGFRQCNDLIFGTLTRCSACRWERWLKIRQFSCLAFVPHLKPPALNFACSCAPYFTYAEDWAKFNLGAVQGTLPQSAGRWTSSSDRSSGNIQALISNSMNLQNMERVSGSSSDHN